MITRRVSIIDFMTAARDELRRLVEQLPDEQVLTVLAEVRRLAEAPPEVGWPPRLGSARSQPSGQTPPLA